MGSRFRVHGRLSGGWSARGVLIESAAMKLAELLEGVAGASVRGDPATEVRGLAYHTRDVADGTLFFCVPGLTFDGHGFAARAAASGAAALVCERDTGVALPRCSCRPYAAPWRTSRRAGTSTPRAS